MADDEKDTETPKYIYYGSEDWIPQANRLVKTFRSGLCMITQDYICRNDDNLDYESFREGDKINDSSPCMDDAYIFPAPDYQDMGNGFIKCTVTAYGRVNTTGCVDLGRRLGDYISTTAFVTNNAGVLNSGSSDTTSKKLFDFAVYRFAAMQGEIIGTPSIIELKIYGLNGVKLPEGSFTTQLGGSANTRQEHYALGSEIERYDAINYGTYSEVIICVVATGYYTKYTESSS
jgi:hypothetical protein